MKKRYVIVGNKPWCKEVFKKLKKKNFYLIEREKLLSSRYIEKLRHSKIFVLHWNKMIPSKIYQKFETIIFHMTDVPFGRGGSPLQNLIIRGYKISKLSAIKCTKKIDGGPVYLKKKYSLNGNADLIFKRISQLTVQMINQIIIRNIKPIKQKGKVIFFKRRSEKQNDLKKAKNIIDAFNMIRMLDGENYPNAYKIWKIKIEIS